jgi:hypothetical protein
VRGERKELEIVGVAADTHAAGLRASPPATVYVAYAQLTGDFPSTLTVRVAGPPSQIGAAIRESLCRRGGPGVRRITDLVQTAPNRSYRLRS